MTITVNGVEPSKMGFKFVEIDAVVTRADGRVENLGLISAYHVDPKINARKNRWIRLKDKFRTIKERFGK
jgi:hypothetical protein